MIIIVVDTSSAFWLLIMVYAWAKNPIALNQNPNPKTILQLFKKIVFILVFLYLYLLVKISQ